MINDFLSNVNLVFEENMVEVQHRPLNGVINRFIVKLKENKHVRTDTFELRDTNNFRHTIKLLGHHHFGVNPKFNNNSKIFWFKGVKND